MHNQAFKRACAEPAGQLMHIGLFALGRPLKCTNLLPCIPMWPQSGPAKPDSVHYRNMIENPLSLALMGGLFGSALGLRDHSRCDGLALRVILVGMMPSEIDSEPVFWQSRVPQISREAVEDKESETLTSNYGLLITRVCVLERAASGDFTASESGFRPSQKSGHEKLLRNGSRIELRS
jgi:hypothetical protein